MDFQNLQFMKETANPHQRLLCVQSIYGKEHNFIDWMGPLKALFRVDRTIFSLQITLKN